METDSAMKTVTALRSMFETSVCETDFDVSVHGSDREASIHGSDLEASVQGSDFEAPVTVRGSDSVIEFPCNPCGKGGTETEAINYCYDCAEYFCAACTANHDKFGGTAGHSKVARALAGSQTEVLGTGAAAATDPPPTKEVCQEHHGERITTYCADHDLVVCNTCVSVEHRRCDGVSYIPKVATNSKQSKDIDSVKNEISNSLKTIPQTKLSIQDGLKALDAENKDHLEAINDSTQRLIQHARKLEQLAIDDSNVRHKTAKDKLQTGLQSLDDASKSMTQRLHSLDNAAVNGDSQVFVDIKRGKREVESVEELKQSLTCLISTAEEKVMPEFVVSEDVEGFLADVHSLGQFSEKEQEKSGGFIAVFLSGDYDIEMKGDEDPCEISGICELDDGSIIIADYGNECLKQLDGSFKPIESLKMPNRPWAVCNTSQNEIAVTLTAEKKVLFVRARGQQLTKLSKSFKVADKCRGICFSQEELFVSCGGHPGGRTSGPPEGPGFVGVYDLNGSPLRTIKFDRHGQQIFSIPSHIAATESGKRLHIADREKGVITIDRRGKVLATFFADALKWARGICAVTESDIIVCGLNSYNVLHINAVGEMVSELLGLEDPWSVTFLKDRSQLIVTQWKSNKIKVFNLMQ